PVSAALGELADGDGGDEPITAELEWVKMGLAGAAAGWRGELTGWAERVGRERLIAVVYADWPRCGAPEPMDAVNWARDEGVAGVLVDTAIKDGRRLGAWRAVTDLQRIVRAVRDAGQMTALAGSLTVADIGWVSRLKPDIVAVRGAACEGGREGRVVADRVTELKAALAGD
ncbi:MAG: (5-formylfuran-3-yl)methyl phosphate synthase, partial [Phycisphaeraceae bacterium]|nr:(5-formylfuran-3-yl)methyl phosphate synthase [Phycisphaeraceae bacterium]